MAPVITNPRTCQHLLSKCMDFVHSFPPTSNISLNLQFGSFRFDFSHNPSSHADISLPKKIRVRAPSDRRRNKLRRTKYALDHVPTAPGASFPDFDISGMSAPAQGPPGTSAPSPGPPGTIALAPGPPGTSARAPGPPAMITPAPGPPGTSAFAPGPPGTSARAPGPPGTSARAPGPPGMITPAPGPPGTSAFAPGPPSACAPGLPGTTGHAPDPPKTSAPAPGTSASAPGPPGRTAPTPGSALWSQRMSAPSTGQSRKIASTHSSTGTLAPAAVPSGTTADPATDPSGASSQEHCGKCKKLYPDSYRYKCKITKCHCSTDFCSSYCHQNWRNLWGYHS